VSSRLAAVSRYPFPQARKLDGLCYPTQASTADVVRAFEAWRSEIVTGDGARGFLRARRPDTPDGVPNSTVSEGIAYGMLIAVVLDEQAMFDDFYRYALCFENKSGLMDWYIAPDGVRPLAVGAATDSDEDIAWALVMAHRQWGGAGALADSYFACAKRQIERVWAYEVDHDRYPDMLLPGDDWRGQNVFNPSYFAPHQYRIFAEISGNSGWLRVVDRGYEIVEASLTLEHGNRDNGLVPAWCNASGVPVEAFPGAMTNYQYDSARLPFRIGQDWAASRDRRALAYLKRVSAFFVGIGAAQIVDGYTLRGEPAPDPRAAHPNPGSAVFVGAAAVAAMHDPAQQAFIDAAYARLRTGKLLARSRYYNHSWTVLSLLMLTGNLLDFPA
jgi:endo-1,4-beta-D-glucanase Y